MGGKNSKSKRNSVKVPSSSANDKGEAESSLSPEEREKQKAVAVDKVAKEIAEEGVGDGEVVYNESGTVVKRDDFELLTVIGKGSFGKVLQVRYKNNGKIYAMKVLKKDAIIARKQITHTKAEKSILQKVQHPFIVKLHFAFQTADKLYMILDYINGGELFYHLKKEGRFSEERVRLYGAEIASALMHLHGLDVVYRDLKPENILIDQTGHIVITDFGLSKEIDQNVGTHTFCGTPEYLAPEILKSDPHGMGVDWWSLGTLLFEMLTGLPPFFSTNINLMYQKILSADIKFPPHVSPEAQSLLNGFLTRDPEKRLGSKESGGEIKIREHPFFAPIDWAALDKREVKPSWIPPVADAADTSQIDSVFTKEEVRDSPPDDEVSPVANANAPAGEGGTKFDGFTFVDSSVLSGKK